MIHVLVVDDHAVVRRLLVTLLQAAGRDWRVSSAAGGEQALATLQADPADAVVLDLSMPGMSGIELLQRMRADFGATPALVLSMHDEQPYRQRAFECGADAYILKDRADAELVPALCSLLDRRAGVTG